MSIVDARVQVGDLVKDWRRINVSFTRARSKLIIFGSRRTLRAAPILAEFLELMEAQEWICNLPPRAHTSYSLQPVSLSYPRKRTAQDLGNLPGKENASSGAGVKKLKPLKRSLAESASGMANGRPILRDLIVNGAY
jgi:DNA replication ATP-dependent helicase Dna2